MQWGDISGLKGAGNRVLSFLIQNEGWSPLPPSSWKTSLVWCYDWVSLESVPPYNSISLCPKAEFLFHVTLQAMKQEALRFQDPWWKNYAESELFDYQAPKTVTSYVSKRGWNNDDDNFPCIIQEKRAKVVCSLWKLRKIIMFQSWLISIKKSYS